MATHSNFMCSLYTLPVSACVSSGCSDFLPQSKDIGHDKNLGGIVVGAGSLGQMASVCTVDSMVIIPRSELNKINLNFI